LSPLLLVARNHISILTKSVLFDDAFINPLNLTLTLMRVGNMKKNKLAMGLSLTILVAFCGGGIAHAVGAASQHPMSKVDTVQTKNSRQKTPHSGRKEAAKRLKQTHLQQQHQHGGAKAKQGQSQAVASVGNNQTPASQGGVK
jgi:hypothetical protein